MYIAINGVLYKKKKKIFDTLRLLHILTTMIATEIFQDTRLN